jgi:hypothetical protein
MTIVQRTIPSNLEAVLGDQHTEPFNIVKIEFEAATQYLSESREVTFETNEYLEGAITVGKFRWGPDGTQSGTISLLNENNAASALILSNTIQDIPITIYEVYATGPSSNSDPTIVVTGVMSGSSLNPKEAVVQVLTSKGDTEFVPSAFYTIEEGYNWLPPVGTVVQWNGEKYVLQGIESG